MSKVKTPLSTTLEGRLHEIIQNVEPGEKLPSEPKLAKQLGVSRATLRESMRSFEVQGFLHRKQGSGTYVTRTPPRLDAGLEILESIETLAKRINLPVQMTEAEISVRIGTPEECNALGILHNSQVLFVSRLIAIEDRKVAYLTDTLPVDVINHKELDTKFTGSVLDYILKSGDPILDYSRTEINAISASPEIAKLLGIQRGDALLRFVASLNSVSGNVIDYSFSYFIPGFFAFHVNRLVNVSY